MLRQRVATALAGIAILLLVLWFGRLWGWTALVAAAGVAGALEFYALAHGSGARPLTVLGCLVVAVLIISPSLPPHTSQAALLGTAILIVSFIWLLARRDTGGALAALGWTLAGVFYVGWFARYLVALRAVEDGRAWLLLALFTTFAVDTAAFFVGRAWGRRPLAPRVSPNKTVEGATAGLLGGTAAALVLSRLLDLPMSAWQALLLGLLVGIFAQLGDLTESLFKRSAGVKDAGRLMPGHGGILDRADSLLLAGAVVYYYVAFLR
ncbi:MAG: phosphatidate cytidylyltransferase [Chloroflexi bacterium]|nr:phosphatidate cytidylyltransferase [Chloroflexota bacterium]